MTQINNTKDKNKKVAKAETSLDKIKRHLKPYIPNLIQIYGSKKAFYEDLYKELKLKHNINVYKRKTEDIDKSKALMDYIREDECKILMEEIYIILYKCKAIEN